MFVRAGPQRKAGEVHEADAGEADPGGDRAHGVRRAEDHLGGL